MIGHMPIIRMRMAGRKPKIVFINDWETIEARDWHTPGAAYGHQWPMDNPTVQIDDGDVIDRLDLRFLSGVIVSATGRTESRAKALFAACKRAGATTVAAVHAIGLGTASVRDGWSDIYHAEQHTKEHAHG